ncbi:hypothetical protein X772_30540 [Mesorhizobium sp. LSJC280B00]|nr:hypothetical protein X772_30540 [Mesorhizobium sp. LSJC280B00]
MTGQKIALGIFSSGSARTYSYFGALSRLRRFFFGAASFWLAPAVAIP